MNGIDPQRFGFLWNINHDYKKEVIMRILGIALLVLGVVLLVFGIYQFVEFRGSFGGKAASLGNKMSKSLGGSGKVAKGYAQPIILIVCGVAAGGVGFFLFKNS